MHPSLSVRVKTLALAIGCFAYSPPQAAAPAVVQAPEATHQSARAIAEPAHRWQNPGDFTDRNDSPEVRQFVAWIIDSGDHQQLPFAVVDKAQSQVQVFSAKGDFRGAAPALLGLTVGDVSVHGIGTRPLSTIRPAERITPAGRFLAVLDRNLKGHEILWVSYADAISLHPVTGIDSREMRGRRLATKTPSDNRITFGCINVDRHFFNSVVLKTFKGTKGIVYVLPEVSSLRSVFPLHGRYTAP